MTTTEKKDLKLEVFDPPMCCSSGVCGPDVDQNLVDFAATVQWLKMNGVHVERFSPLHQYAAFAANATVSKTINEKGIDCLPLILLDGEIVSTGAYPGRLELSSMTGLVNQEAAEFP